MGITILGVAPFVSTTVSNATTPTTTEFSVTSPTGFKVRMGLVVGGSQLTQITNIVGDVFTVNPPITAPSPTDTVVNFSVEYTNALGNSMAMWKELTVASLRAVADTGFTDTPPTLVYCAELGVLQWDSTSSATDDGVNVIKPTATSGSGRWLLKVTFNVGGIVGSWSTITTDTALTSGVNYVLNSTSRLNLTLPSSFNMGGNFQIKSKNTGGFKVTLASGDTVYYGDVILTYPFNIIGCKYTSANITAIETDAKWSVECGYGSGVLWFDFDRGYFAGGYDGSTTVATIDKLTFSTQAISNIAATLNAARMWHVGGASNVSNKGYWFTGTTTTSTANGTTEIDGVNMTNDAALNPGATLTTASSNAYAMVDYIGDKIFIAGGLNTSDVNIARLERFNSAAETVSAVTDTLVQPTNSAARYMSATHGYGACGRQSTTPTNQFTLNQFHFVNEAAEETRNVLKAIQSGANPPIDSAAQTDMLGASYHDGGFIFTGNTARIRVVGKIPFDNGAEIHKTATLGVDRNGGGITQSADYAFLAGNNTNTNNSITAYHFVNDTQSTIAAVLVGNRNAPAGLP